MYSNRMTKLLNKIEIWLGTKLINLPPELAKGEPWVEVIDDFTLDTFSRYFPNKIKMKIDQSMRKSDGYYYIDIDKFPGCEIIGVRDICWGEFNDNASMYNTSPQGIYDFFTDSSSLEDIAFVQMRADQLSLFNNGIYLDFEPPNKIKVGGVSGINNGIHLMEFNVEVFIKHSLNLNTIAPTKMQIFEKLARADVAMFLYNNLKMFEGLETVYGNIDLKLNELDQIATTRDQIEEELKAGYVSAANDNQPMIYTV